jgi:hypothetical protein
MALEGAGKGRQATTGGCGLSDSLQQLSAAGGASRRNTVTLWSVVWPTGYSIGCGDFADACNAARAPGNEWQGKPRIMRAQHEFTQG